MRFLQTGSLLIIWILSAFFAQASPAPIDIFVSIPPQKWLVDRIGGSSVNSHILVKEGQNPHTFEPTPKQIAALTKAAIWFTMNMDFEEQLVKKVQKIAPSLRVIDISHHVTKKEAAHHDHHHDDHHQLTNHDPHIWLSPLNLKIMANEITEAFSHTSQKNSDTFTTNQKKVVKELDVLHKHIQTLLAPYKGKTFYVYHPSFGYFADAYNLRQHPVEIEGKSPSPRQLTKLIKKARAERIKVIFVQPQFDPKSGKAIADAIGGKVVPLDALSSDIPGNLKKMANAIKSAFILQGKN